MDANERRAAATDGAAHWWTRLGTKAPADLSEMDRQEFTEWLRESPLHVAELLQVAHVHDTLERFKLWDEISVSTGNIDANVIPLNANPPAPLRVNGFELLPQREMGGRRGVGFFLAASVPLIALAAVWLALHSSATTIETDRAERREVVLSDGSVVNLEPETSLRVDLGKVRRYVVLTRGRALFHVAKDPARPFIVHAGDTNVRAVGTIFGVEQKNQNIIVTVSEGKVGIVPSVAISALARANAPENPHAQRLSSHAEREAPAQREGEAYSPPDSATGDSRKGIASGQRGEVFLTSNQQITVRESGDATPVQEVDASRALAWSAGRLVFDSTPLSEVVEEFNRYNRVQLYIDSPEIARRTVSGVFRASDPETLIEFLGAGAHVVATRRDNEEIVISPGS